MTEHRSGFIIMLLGRKQAAFKPFSYLKDDYGKFNFCE